MLARLFLTLIFSISSIGISCQLVSAKDERNLAVPNCFDSAFMEYGGCISGLIAIEISDQVIAISNCYLTGQLSHLLESQITCMSTDKLCLKDLTFKQKELLIFVMNNIGVYCDSFAFRKSLFLRNKFIGALQETSEIIKNTMEDAVKAHDKLSKEFKSTLEEVKNISNSHINTSKSDDLTKETEKLLKEVEKMDILIANSPIDLKYLGGQVDLYLYIAVFFLKVLFLMIHAAVSSYQPLDISLMTLVADLVLGIFMDLTVRQLENVALIALTVSSRYLTSTRLLIFLYFGIWRFIHQTLKSSANAQHEDYLIQNIGATIKKILNEDVANYYPKGNSPSNRKPPQEVKPEPALNHSKQRRSSDTPIISQEDIPEIPTSKRKSRNPYIEVSPLSSPSMRNSSTKYQDSSGDHTKHRGR